MVVPLHVRDAMTSPAETVSPETAVATAARRMHDATVGSLVVVEDDAPVGIVTEGDIVGLVADGADPTATVVRDVMRSPVTTAEADDDLETAATMLREEDIKRLPVLDDGSLVGILTTTDLAYYLPRFALSVEAGRPRADYARLGTDVTAYEDTDWEFHHEGEEDGLSVGDVIRFRKVLSDADVRAFAEASGDTNRLHLDGEFASETRFGKRIAHGTLVSGTISAALARLPGLTIYLSQDLRFLGPVEVGDTIAAVCEVVEDLGGGKFRLVTAVYDVSDVEAGAEEEGARVVDGEAVVLVDDLPYSVEEKLETPDTG
ncbi:CBS domain-containing protein [Halomarina litorea]|uniref:CBS domain-containing protein n=1 Tax=Halomarina litorea TaxID=2961595 RepID=UPI0020C405D1|nr:CBS domain-containing protein [Halomarina sp. BCD28]